MLPAFGIDPGVCLVTLRHEHNTSFRVDAPGGPYVLRISRPGVASATTVASEAAWLEAVRRDTPMCIPEPLRTTEGATSVAATGPGIAEQRICALFRWQPGRFVDARLTPWMLGEVGAATVALQRHAATWLPPDGFFRPRVDTLTAAARAASLAPTAAEALPGDHPTDADIDALVALTSGLVSNRDGDLVRAAIDEIRVTTRALAGRPGTFGLIHGDLHQWNYFFDGRALRVIDFDECGWGFFLYDLAVTIFELTGRASLPALRGALLDAYAAGRPLPPNHEHHLVLLIALRRLQVAAWILESRDHAAFRADWQQWTRDELDGLARDLDSGRLAGAG